MMLGFSVGKRIKYCFAATLSEDKTHGASAAYENESLSVWVI